MTDSTPKPPPKAHDYVLKLVMVGDANVGKSSILLRFTDDRFEQDHLSTIGVDLRVKTIETPDGKRVKITIWDTAGQERFRTLTASYFHKVQGLILTYDVTSRESFEHLGMWNDEIEANVDGSPVVKVLVGNKIDEPEKRQVSKKEGEMWAREHSMIFIEASAKNRVGIQQVFMECVRQILDRPGLLAPAAGGVAAATLLSQNEVGAENGAGGGCCA